MESDLTRGLAWWCGQLRTPLRGRLTKRWRQKLDNPIREYHPSYRPRKIEGLITKPCATQHDLALAHTFGVAVPVNDIARDPLAAFLYTARGNLVSVVTNEMAVLGPRDVDSYRAASNHRQDDDHGARPLTRAHDGSCSGR